MKAAKSYTEATSKSVAKIRKLNLVSHISVFYNKVLIFPKSNVRNQKIDNTVLKAEIPHAIWNANYYKTYLYPCLTARLGPQLWKTGWHHPWAAARTHLSLSVGE